MKNFYKPSIVQFIKRSMSCMKNASQKNLVGIIQMTSTSNKDENIKQATNLICSAKEKGVKMVFLPESCDFIGENKEQSLLLSESIDGSVITHYRTLAKKLDVWISIGGFHQKHENFEEDKRIKNTHVVIDASGEIQGKYSKTHLFDVDIKGKVCISERSGTIPGTDIGPPVDSPVGKLGLGICYDLRFPEFSLALSQQGAEILLYPSAFTIPTGIAHWKVLLQCRAVENQCFVIAAAQVGQHNAKRSSYGHSMIVDPWGTILAECTDEIGFCVAEIDHTFMQQKRLEMPIVKHRRHDLYGHVLVKAKGNIDSQTEYIFGQYVVPSSAVFYKTSLSFAFVNKKPVLPGHVLICPIRPVERFSELSSAEVADIFICTQQVAKVIEKEYGGSSATIAIQDGPEAGQTVTHVHVHILPRKVGDFDRNDDIYDKLENHDKNVKASDWRSDQDMAEEAAQLRPLFL